jgi:bacteriorhodopsin
VCDVFYCTFHFVVEVKVSCIFVERNTTFRYAYYSIRICCVFHIYVTIVVDYGRSVPKLLGRRVHDAASGRKRNTFQVS